LVPISGREDNAHEDYVVQQATVVLFHVEIYTLIGTNSYVNFSISQLLQHLDKRRYTKPTIVNYKDLDFLFGERYVPEAFDSDVFDESRV
jgi:hypothetical protein